MPVVATSSAQTSAGNQNLSCPIPTGTQNGHLMVAGYVVASSQVVEPPPGWSVFENDVNPGGGTMKCTIVWKVKATGDVAPVFHLPATSTGKGACFCISLSGREATPTFGAHVIRIVSAATTVAPAVSPPAAGADLLAIFFEKGSSQTGVTPPAGMTEAVEEVVGGGGSVSIEVAYQSLSSSGSTGTKTATYDIATGLGYGVLMYAGASANNPPSVNAGSDQNTQAGVEVTMAGTTTDTDGTITSRQWTQTSGPTVTLTGATTNTAKFTPTAAGVYVFTLTATDNLGSQGTDSITISVAGNTSRPISTSANPGVWGAVGPQATVVLSVADDDDASYAETPAGPNNASVTFKLAPVAAGNIIVRTRDKQDVASPVITRKVELLQGASVIATFATFPLTTDWVDHTFTLTSLQNAAVTDRTNLFVRVTDLTA